MCKAIGDSSTPDEEIQNTQNGDDDVVVATTQSNNISSDSENSISRFRSMITTLPPLVFVVCMIISLSFQVLIFPVKKI